MLQSRNPYSAELIEAHQSLNEKDMSDAIEKARTAFADWSREPLSKRAECLQSVARELREAKDKLARLMALEMGKPVREGGPEVEKSAWCAEYFAEHAEAFLADEVLASDAARSYVTYEPLGTVLGILPWNAPLWLAFRFLAPALMAGNTCVMKHDPNVPACAQAIADVFRKAGLPEGVMINLPIETSLVEQAIRHPAIAAVSFTGSAAAGAKVAAVAGSEIKPAVLELGGSDPCIIMADADLDKAADVATLSRIINAGQSCIAAKRILVEATVYERMLDKLHERLARLQMGDPLDADTQIGPIAREDLRDVLHRQVKSTIESGARCLLGGELPEGDGYAYPVTLLADVTPDMCAFREETFGPVMAVTSVADFEEALSLANDTEYGLGAAIWTEDQGRIDRAVRELVAGQVAVNGIVKTDPRLPSGGVRRSGYGRELGPHGIREFVNAKQVWIR
ncbi:MAG: succinate-semialdehyde dehydrogenase [unclassified Hahellaceae]|nr:succinate-semialdehyde dehydrogenase [Hahellaceae bacterium]|tara:strand:- start:9807 stop:11168 length:1362 start_codon:yes stop_codon:yes gene_type:complete